MARRKSRSTARKGAFVGAAAAALLAFPGAASAAVTSSVTNGDLVVTSDAGDAIAITSVGGQVKVNGANPGNGPAASATIDSIMVTGDSGANNIDLSGVNATDFTTLASVTVDGAGGNDTINGSQLADTIDGGDGADLLSGGNGNDSITGDDNPLNTFDNVRGDAGDDTMIWNGGDDDDINDGGDGNDTTEVNGGGGGEQFEVGPSATPGRVAFDRTGPSPTPGPFNIDIGTTENLRLNAGGGNDKIEGKKGLAGLIASTLNGDDGNDQVKGTDGEDLLSGGKGNDLIRSRDKAADQVEGNGGFDLAFVDKRDTVRGVEIVLGGRLRVRHLGGKAITVAGNTAVVRLRSVATRRVSGRVHLIRGGKSPGSTKYKVTRKPKTIRIKLNQRGLRLLRQAPRKGLSSKLRIDARDANGNGWRTSDSIQLKR